MASAYNSNAPGKIAGRDPHMRDQPRDHRVVGCRFEQEVRLAVRTLRVFSLQQCQRESVAGRNSLTVFFSFNTSSKCRRHREEGTASPPNERSPAKVQTVRNLTIR